MATQENPSVQKHLYTFLHHDVKSAIAFYLIVYFSAIQKKPRWWVRSILQKRTVLDASLLYNASCLGRLDLTKVQKICNKYNLFILMDL